MPGVDDVLRVHPHRRPVRHRDAGPRTADTDRRAGGRPRLRHRHLRHAARDAGLPQRTVPAHGQDRRMHLVVLPAIGPGCDAGRAWPGQLHAREHEPAGPRHAGLGGRPRALRTGRPAGGGRAHRHAAAARCQLRGARRAPHPGARRRIPPPHAADAQDRRCRPGGRALRAAGRCGRPDAAHATAPGARRCRGTGAPAGAGGLGPAQPRLWPGRGGALAGRAAEPPRGRAGARVPGARCGARAHRGGRVQAEPAALRLPRARQHGRQPGPSRLRPARSMPARPTASCSTT